MRTLVLGAGVAGLSCGILLREAGYDAEIWTRTLPQQTTSSVAAAIWYPYIAFPKERVVAWGARTFAVLAGLSRDTRTGVAMREGIEIFPTPVEDPWWRGAVVRFRRAAPLELPEGYLDGFIFEVPVIEMPRYLAYLQERFAGLGGRIATQEAGSLAEALAEHGLVIDCAGLGARELAGDAALYAVRGQVVRVAQVGLDRFWLDDYGPRGLTYIIPRSEDIILGGTADERDERIDPDPATAAAIVERCAALEPRLRDAAILEHKVGLRPARAAVRLEAESPIPGKTVIHNYGHGGAGVTLSWGCAEEVLRLAHAAAGRGGGVV